MTKQLAVKEETQIAKYELAQEDYVQGTDELTREDMQFPLVVLVSAQSKKVPDAIKHVGQLYNNLTGEFYSEINAVLLSEAKGRVAFPREFSGDSDPMCGSDNGIMPRDEYVGVSIKDPDRDITHEIDDLGCAQCPFSQFGQNGETPLCAKTFTYAMLDAETGFPFLFQVQRTGVSAGRQLNTIAKTMGRKKYIRIATRLVESDKGNYFVPVFSTNGDAETEIKTYASQLAGTIGNIAQRARVAEERQVEEEPLPM